MTLQIKIRLEEEKSNYSSLAGKLALAQHFYTVG
jgi:hypothetical protein